MKSAERRDKNKSRDLERNGFGNIRTVNMAVVLRIQAAHHVEKKATKHHADSRPKKVIWMKNSVQIV